MLMLYNTERRQAKCKTAEQPNSRTYRTNGKTQVNVVNTQESVPRNSPLPLPPQLPHLRLIIRRYCVSMTINNLHNMYHIVIHSLLQPSPFATNAILYMTWMSRSVPHFPISCSYAIIPQRLNISHSHYIYQYHICSFLCSIYNILMSN